MPSTTRASLMALGAIGLWSSLATLGVALGHVPPFLLTGLSLLIGSLVALPLSGFKLSRWKVPPSTLALGVYGLFGFHFLLFLALRHAPPVQANLVNYLWPLLIVVLALRSPVGGAWGIPLAAVIAWYVLAKLLELGDHAVFAATQGWVSGHSLKHVFAAMAAWPVMALMHNGAHARLGQHGAVRA